MTRTLVAALLLLVVGESVGLSATEPKPARHYAVVIGSNAPHRPGAARLRFAVSDAVRVHRLLASLPGHSTLFADLAGESLGRDKDLASELRTLELTAIGETIEGFNAEIAAARQRGWSTHFYIYYSGHGDLLDGTSEPESYLAMVGEKVDATQIIDWFDRSEADTKHLFVDACHADALAKGEAVGVADAEALTQGIGKARISKRPEIGFVVSTGAQESNSLAAGVMTHVVLSSLSGLADTDSNGVITYGELYRHALHSGLANGGNGHGVTLRVEPPRHDYDQPALDLRRAPTKTELSVRISIPAGSAGRYRVLRDAQPYLEWWSEPNREVTVLVPRLANLQLERQDPWRSDGDRARWRYPLSSVMETLVPAVRLAEVGWRTLRERGLEAVSGLFAAPYGPVAAATIPVPTPMVRRLVPDGPRTLYFGRVGGETPAKWRALAKQLVGDTVEESLDTTRWDLRPGSPLPETGCHDAAAAGPLAEAPKNSVELRLCVEPAGESELLWSLWAVTPGGRKEVTGSSRVDPTALRETLGDAVAKVVAQLPHRRAAPAEVEPPGLVGRREPVVWQDRPTRPTARLWGGAGLLTAAGVVLAGSLWAEAVSEDARRCTENGDCRQAARAQHYDLASEWGYAGTALLGVGGAALIAWYLLDQPTQAGTVFGALPVSRGGMLVVGLSY